MSVTTGMAKTKFSKEEKSQGGKSLDFIERRRSALERYLNRTARHPVLRKDGAFLEFLQSQEEVRCCCLVYERHIF